MPSFRTLWGFAAAHEVLLLPYLELASLVSYAGCCGWLCMRAAWLHELIGGTIGAMGALCLPQQRSLTVTLAWPFWPFRCSPSRYFACHLLRHTTGPVGPDTEHRSLYDAERPGGQVSFSMTMLAKSSNASCSLSLALLSR